MVLECRRLLRWSIVAFLTNWTGSRLPRLCCHWYPPSWHHQVGRMDGRGWLKKRLALFSSFWLLSPRSPEGIWGICKSRWKNSMALCCYSTRSWQRLPYLSVAWNLGAEALVLDFTEVDFRETATPSLRQNDWTLLLRENKSFILFKEE